MFRRLPLSRGCFRMLSSFSLLLGAAGASLAQYWPGYPPAYQPPYPYRPYNPGYQVVGPIPVNGQQPIMLTTARPPCVWPGTPQPLGMPVPAPQGYAPYPGMAPSPMTPTLPTPTTPSTPSTTPSTPSTTPSTPSTPSTEQGQGTAAAPTSDNTDSGQSEPGPQTGEQSGTPYVFGNLLQGKRSISFPVSRSQGISNVIGTGSTTVVNPKIAENNSPIPRDRIGVRYNYFADSLKVTGIAAQDIPDFQRDPGRGAIRQDLPETRAYDVHMYTLDMEKTFLDGTMSVQLRVPYTQTLSNKLDLTYGTVNGLTPGVDFNGNPVGFNVLNVTRSPQLTLGEESSQFGDMTLIFKGILLADCDYTVSGGMSVLIPTAPDTRVRVTDYSGNVNLPNPEFQRIREFRISNSTWALSPFVAFLATPCPRLFVQGFAQFEIPLNESDVQFEETIPLVRPGLVINRQNLASPDGKFPPFVEKRQIREQALMHLDLNVGYWVWRDLSAQWITGVAPALELHYTRTLNNSQVLNLQRDFLFEDFPTPADPSQVGNRSNKIDILDMTFGTTVEVARRALVGTAFSIPLLKGDNRTYDWEFQFQLNYLFGSSAGRPSAPFTQ